MAEVVTVEVGAFQKLLAKCSERHDRRYHRSPRTREQRPRLTLEVAGDDG
jgi:hypothetical protein